MILYEFTSIFFQEKEAVGTMATAAIGEAKAKEVSVFLYFYSMLLPI